VLITHSHVDHAGGMSYFQKKGIPVMISEKDWGPVGGAPNPAAILRDNQVITLGDTKVTVIYTPGHSPGAVTFVFPVFEHGKRHMAALMGGVGPRGDVTVHQTAIETLGHMLAFGRSVGMDVLFQPHEIMEDPVAMQYVLDAAAHPGVQPNAYILGEKRLQDYGQMLTTCWKARIEIMQSGHAPVGRGAGAPQ
jgi:metallo-beta-lactamase class B